jgi:hypothetical protein
MTSNTLYSSRTKVNGTTPETTTERVAYAAFHVLEGAVLTTAQVAEMTNMTWQGADELMNRMSRVVPIVKIDSRWQTL